jgi:hypothetical protein
VQSKDDLLEWRVGIFLGWVGIGGGGWLGIRDFFGMRQKNMLMDLTI